jgi:integral membrane protein
MPTKPSLLAKIGRFEGLSFLLLLGIAMPLKYLAGRPEAVQWVGWAHGVLFILYLVLIAKAWAQRRWPLARPFLLVAAAFFPFGPFLIEPRLRRWEAEAEGLPPSPH